MYSCDFSSEIVSLNLIQGSLELRDLCVCDLKTKDWSWSASHAVISWSWFDLLRLGSCGLQVEIHNFYCDSRCFSFEGNSWCALYPHILELTAPAVLNIPFHFSSLCMHEGIFCLYSDEYIAELCFSSDLQSTSHTMYSNFVISNGYIKQGDKKIVDQFEGKGFYFVSDHDQEDAAGIQQRYELNAQVQCMELPPLERDVTVNIKWNNGIGDCRLYNDNKTIDVSCVVSDSGKVTSQLTMLPSHVVSYWPTLTSVDLDGIVKIEAAWDWLKFDTSFKAHILGENFYYLGYSLPDFEVTIKSLEKNIFLADCILFDEKEKQAVGSWSYDASKSYFSGHIETYVPYNLPGNWSFDSGKFDFYGDIFQQKNISLDYSCAVQSLFDKSSYVINGSGNITTEKIYVDGAIEGKMFSACFGLHPLLYCDHIKYAESEINFIGSPDGFFEGEFSYGIVRRFIQMTGNDFPGEGRCKLRGRCIDREFKADYMMSQATIRIPWTYSVVKNLSGKLQGNFNSGILYITDMKASLYKGEVTASKITLWWDKAGELRYFHAPFILNNCFLSWKKDLFTQVSGALVFDYTPDQNGELHGMVLLDHSHMRGNVLSAEFQNEFLGHGSSSLVSQIQSEIADGRSGDCNVNLVLETRTPLEIRTPFLDSSARCSIAFNGPMSAFEIEGEVEFLTGTLKFPYKPLFIERGILSFVPQRPYDPLIDLVARNMIKKYAVELTLTGSAQSPRVQFGSSPVLDREQIITLLLGGSEDGSLYLLMPQMITNTLEHLIFGTSETSSHVQKYLKNLLRPFKNIRITPRLGDETGRGGIRGSVAVEVNDRLHGIVEKNFSFPEDTTFEVEYLVSDDTSFRILKDERGDVGGEVEMRWKF